jgi:hypothetical protein
LIRRNPISIQQVQASPVSYDVSLHAPTPTRELDDWDEKDAVLPIDGALNTARLGVPVAPAKCGEKTPAITNYQNLATTDQRQIKIWAEEHPYCNWLALAKPDGVCFIDEDQAEKFRALYEEKYGEAFPRTRTTQSRAGHKQSIWKQTDRTRAFGNQVQSAFQDRMLSFRQNNQYCMAQGSHLNASPENGPTPRDYDLVDDSPIAEMPDKLMDLLESLLVKKTKKSRKSEPKLIVGGKAVENPPNPGFKALFEAVGFQPLVRRLNKHVDSRFHDLTLGEGEENTYCPIPSHGPQDINVTYKKCFGVVAGEPSLLHCFGCDWSGDLVGACYEVDGDSSKTMYDVARAICAEENFKFEEFFPTSSTQQNVKTAPSEIKTVSDSPYDMTEEEIAAQEDAEYPVYKLRETAGPHFSDEALYGPLAIVARKICRYSEAHVGTVYLNLLVSFGNMMGRGAYFNVGSTKHYTNENLACVGSSSKGRKGSSSDGSEPILHLIDSTWMNNRNVGGFSTPQAVLSQIKDDSRFQRLNKSTKLYEDILQPGVADKRLCIRESEMSNVFKLISDPKNKAGELFRNLWDGKQVSNLVAGKTEVGEHNSLICREPHVSIIGSTTPSLAKATLPIGADKSGDGNRIIWCYTKRTQLSPQGGPLINWAEETLNHNGSSESILVYFYEAISKARASRLIPLAKNARKFWDCLYLRLENDQRSDFLGGMTARAAAHIRRMAMILALLDKEDAVSVKHLKAAEAIWDYSQESARFIFSGYSKEQEKILRLAYADGEAGISLTDIHTLFSRKKEGEWVRAQVQGLEDEGYLMAVGDTWRFKKW